MRFGQLLLCAACLGACLDSSPMEDGAGPIDSTTEATAPSGRYRATYFPTSAPPFDGLDLKPDGRFQVVGTSGTAQGRYVLSEEEGEIFFRSGSRPRRRIDLIADDGATLASFLYVLDGGGHYLSLAPADAFDVAARQNWSDFTRMRTRPRGVYYPQTEPAAFAQLAIGTPDCSFRTQDGAAVWGRCGFATLDVSRDDVSGPLQVIQFLPTDGGAGFDLPYEYDATANLLAVGASIGSPRIAWTTYGMRDVAVPSNRPTGNWRATHGLDPVAWFEELSLNDDGTFRRTDQNGVIEGHYELSETGTSVELWGGRYPWRFINFFAPDGTAIDRFAYIIEFDTPFLVIGNPDVPNASLLSYWDDFAQQ